MILPTRPLLGSKPLRYVSAENTDVRKTFRRARLLAHLRGQQMNLLLSRDTSPDKILPLAAHRVSIADRVVLLTKPDA